MVKCLLTMWETWVRSLGQEDPLEKGMETHSSIHAWKIPWTKEPGGLQSMGSQRTGQDWVTSLHYNHNNQQINLWRILGQLMKIVLVPICFFLERRRRTNTWLGSRRPRALRASWLKKQLTLSEPLFACLKIWYKSYCLVDLAVLLRGAVVKTHMCRRVVKCQSYYARHYVYF